MRWWCDDKAACIKLHHRGVRKLCWGAAGSIKGALRASGLVFTPASFTRAQIEAVQSFYHRNKYVEYSMVKNWGVRQPLAFLSEHCPGGNQLESVYASHSITEEVTFPSVFHC